MKKKQQGSRLTKTVTDRIAKLLASDKYTYREISERCKVSCATVGRLNSKLTGGKRKTTATTKSAQA